MTLKRNFLAWAIYFAFAIAAVALSWHDRIIAFHGTHGAVKALIWSAFFAFTAYSMYCSSKENIFGSIGKMFQLHWGRQVGLDLYIGLLLFLCLINMHSGFSMLLFWALPILLFGNLFTLLYLALNFESLIALFTG